MDVAIVGAGPVGLSFAAALAADGVSVALIECQPLDALHDPQPDGREIALTHATRSLLQRLGIWQRISPQEVSPLRDARVFNGASPFAMTISSGRSEERTPLGFLVSNHLIRRAAFEVASSCKGIHWHQASVERIDSDDRCARLWLSDGTHIEAALAVAADSRFSETRRQMGIAAQMRDNGRTMLVCRMTHDKAHDQSAWEWFDHGQTLALLPLGEHCSSVVLTLTKHEMDELQALDDSAFAAQIARRFDYRLGEMRKQGEAHTYPLVSVYAERFVARRFALIGDAAVGMHPVTAHGFNLGVQGQQRLADRVLDARRRGLDIGASRVLSGYQREHRLASRPLYLATQAIVSLYTDDRLPARLLRYAGLRLAEHAAPLKGAIAHHLIQDSGTR
ncbi:MULTISPECIES: 5-demethoxyubiquinol-8 5-hydroxylase UbiM [unclassified Halomonas]|uniref:5-demethoxyubiquinol-8 5-hydroxylase UbiM n=1 Tax=unclassified Halomonas TaxID=2609666 RepID=UPI0020B82EC0|nr:MULTISPECIES: 5-demethoxyubiquinol-8 5-hydroxylase UbiM [unclassified Halomonas]